MKLATVLDFIDNGHFALPQLQRSFVWNRDQVRKLFYSLYKRWPVGQLILWVTQSDSAECAVRGSPYLGRRSKAPPRRAAWRLTHSWVD